MHAYLQTGHPLFGDRLAGASAEPCASLKVPLLRAGVLEAMLCVDFDRPQVLAVDQCRLVEEAAQLAWSAILHARAQQALHASSAHLEATLLELMTLNATLEERVASMLAERESDLMQLHEARKMETVGQLTGGIAHDFNNMLTPIIATLELIARRPDAPAQLCPAPDPQAATGVTGDAGQRHARTDQPFAGADHRHPHRHCHIDIAADLPAAVIDPHQLEVALLNLVVNARDAMAQGGHLRISAGLDSAREDRPAGLEAGEVIWLEVADTGCGMSEDVLAHCFEPFYSTKGVGKGTGLGLPMVQGLSLQSGGDFAIRSQLGKGTVATLW